MTQEHPINPPPELVQEWLENRKLLKSQPLAHTYLATRAAQWGADQELEACISWMRTMGYWGEDGCAISKLRAARRPKPPSLKEQALDELHISFDRGYLKEGAADTIRRALEQLPDNE
jgi:hypothetical protein